MKSSKADILVPTLERGNEKIKTVCCQDADPDSNAPGYTVNRGGLTAGKQPEGWTLNFFWELCPFLPTG
ncbi:MAG: hypothetical protein P9X24_02485 [Candidatus Hatepunaea meridiana]|nr:hypothetical protein [Candidatus Hatepunaea meridiana]